MDGQELRVQQILLCVWRKLKIHYYNITNSYQVDEIVKVTKEGLDPFYKWFISEKKNQCKLWPGTDINLIAKLNILAILQML